MRELYARYLELFGVILPKKVFVPVCRFMGEYFSELEEAYAMMPDLFEPQVELVREQGVLALLKAKCDALQDLLLDQAIGQIKITFK